MGELDRKHFQVAMDAIDRLDSTESEADISAIVERAVACFGLEHFCCAMPKTHQRPTFDACVLMNRWPKGWFEQYRRADFTRYDPIVSFTRSQFRSVSWSEAPIPDEPIARSIMSIAACDYRLRHGISVPIHGLNGYQAGISFSGFDVEQTADAKSAVELIAIYAFNRLNHFRAANENSGRVLTPRQREILSWTALGKTAWDIGQILGISEDTVNKLVAAAIQRLKVSNRTHAVVEAIRRKEIDL